MKSWHSKIVPYLIFFIIIRVAYQQVERYSNWEVSSISENIWNIEGEIKRKSWLTQNFFFLDQLRKCTLNSQDLRSRDQMFQHMLLEEGDFWSHHLMANRWDRSESSDRFSWTLKSLQTVKLRDTCSLEGKL